MEIKLFFSVRWARVEPQAQTFTVLVVFVFLFSMPCVNTLLTLLERWYLPALFIPCAPCFFYPPLMFLVTAEVIYIIPLSQGPLGCSFYNIFLFGWGGFDCREFVFCPQSRRSPSPSCWTTFTPWWGRRWSSRWRCRRKEPTSSGEEVCGLFCGSFTR